MSSVSADGSIDVVEINNALSKVGSSPLNDEASKPGSGLFPYGLNDIEFSVSVGPKGTEIGSVSLHLRGPGGTPTGGTQPKGGGGGAGTSGGLQLKGGTWKINDVGGNIKGKIGVLQNSDGKGASKEHWFYDSGFMATGATMILFYQQNRFRPRIAQERRDAERLVGISFPLRSRESSILSRSRQRFCEVQTLRLSIRALCAGTVVACVSSAGPLARHNRSPFHNSEDPVRSMNWQRWVLWRKSKDR